MINHLCASPRCRAAGKHAQDCAGDDCRGCLPRQAADGLNLCPGCTSWLAENIADAADLYDELADSATGGGSALTGHVSGATSEGSPMPRIGPITAQREIRNVLSSWARLVSEERGIAPPRDEVHLIAAWLGRHVEWLAAHDAAGDVADEMAEAARGRARRSAYPNRTRTIQVGPCPGRPDDEDQCAGQLTALMRTTDDMLPPELVCSVDDGHRWTSAEWVRLGRQLMGAAA